jgi:hypothetical protein
MATLATTVLTPIGLTTTGAAAGQAAGWQSATATTGDLIPLTGRGVILRIKTTGTASNAVIDNVLPSSYGADQDLTVTLRPRTSRRCSSATTAASTRAAATRATRKSSARR